jgi:hypothetical protein
LFESVQQRFETVLSQERETNEWDFYETTDVGHGRQETRRCWCMGGIEDLINAENGCN